jgi:hypothetical protein
MAYWMHRHNWRYEIAKRLDKFYLAVAILMPRRLRMWVVVDSTNTARRLYPDPTGYAGSGRTGLQGDLPRSDPVA